MEAGFHFFEFDTGYTEPLAALESPASNTRMNDGKVDRQGRFVAGSMERSLNIAAGSLYRLDPGGDTETIETDVECANGPC